MNKCQLIIYPDVVLKEKSHPVFNFDASTQDLIKDMSDIMYSYRGIGLAAPQVGFLKRIIIADIGYGLISFINPEITHYEGYEVDEEGCLSLPEIHVNILRHQSVLVKGVNFEGNEIELECGGLMARVLQHEIDHLNGVLIIDHASTVERYLLYEQLDELKRHH